MQNRSFIRQPMSTSNDISAQQAQPAATAIRPSPSISKTAPAPDELARIFNTILVSTRAKKKRDFSSELFDLADSSSFKAILSAVRHLAKVQGITERQASEQVIHTFRKMDELWGEYIFHEGLDRVRGQRT